jgi:hypothetical protein
MWVFLVNTAFKAARQSSRRAARGSIGGVVFIREIARITRRYVELETDAVIGVLERLDM